MGLKISILFQLTGLSVRLQAGPYTPVQLGRFGDTVLATDDWTTVRFSDTTIVRVGDSAVNNRGESFGIFRNL